MNFVFLAIIWRLHTLNLLGKYCGAGNRIEHGFARIPRAMHSNIDLL